MNYFDARKLQISASMIKSALIEADIDINDPDLAVVLRGAEVCQISSSLFAGSMSINPLIWTTESTNINGSIIQNALLNATVYAINTTDTVGNISITNRVRVSLATSYEDNVFGRIPFNSTMLTTVHTDNTVSLTNGFGIMAYSGGITKAVGRINIALSIAGNTVARLGFGGGDTPILHSVSVKDMAVYGKVVNRITTAVKTQDAESISVLDETNTDIDGIVYSVSVEDMAVRFGENGGLQNIMLCDEVERLYAAVNNPLAINGRLKADDGNRIRSGLKALLYPVGELSGVEITRLYAYLMSAAGIATIISTMEVDNSTEIRYFVHIASSIGCGQLYPAGTIGLASDLGYGGGISSTASTISSSIMKLPIRATADGTVSISVKTIEYGTGDIHIDNTVSIYAVNPTAYPVKSSTIYDAEIISSMVSPYVITTGGSIITSVAIKASAHLFAESTTHIAKSKIKSGVRVSGVTVNPTANIIALETGAAPTAIVAVYIPTADVTKSNVDVDIDAFCSINLLGANNVDIEQEFEGDIGVSMGLCNAGVVEPKPLAIAADISICVLPAHYRPIGFYFGDTLAELGAATLYDLRRLYLSQLIVENKMIGDYLEYTMAQMSDELIITLSKGYYEIPWQ